MITIEASDEPTDRLLAAPAGAFDGSDRRRPGRPQHISPHLVALLRSDEQNSVPVFEPDVQRVAVGLGVAVLLSLPLWVMLGLIAWALLG